MCRCTCVCAVVSLSVCDVCLHVCVIHAYVRMLVRDRVCERVRACTACVCGCVIAGFNVCVSVLVCAWGFTCDGLCLIVYLCLRADCVNLRAHNLMRC